MAPLATTANYYRLDQAPLSPGCYQKPHVPILIGGTGERRTMRTLAMFGDIFNLDGRSGRGMSSELYHHKMNVLERHCENVGRDPSEIKRMLLARIRLIHWKSNSSRDEFFNIEDHIPVMLAANGPRGQKIVREMSDGWITTGGGPSVPRGLPRVMESARAAGNSLSSSECEQSTSLTWGRNVAG